MVLLLRERLKVVSWRVVWLLNKAMPRAPLAGAAADWPVDCSAAKAGRADDAPGTANEATN
jgi:hypothetical protein